MLRRIWLCAALLLSVSVAHAELQIEINQGVENPTPIAVVPLPGRALAPPEDAAQIVDSDLARSGQFSLSAAGIC